MAPYIVWAWAADETGGMRSIVARAAALVLLLVRCGTKHAPSGASELVGTGEAADLDFTGITEPMKQESR